MPGPGNVGERVRNLRLSKRLSQAQLAGRDLSDSYISLIESGKRSPTPTVVRLLAHRLGCTPEYLAEGVEPERRTHLQIRARHAELALRIGAAERALDGFLEILHGSDDAEQVTRARWGYARALEGLGRVEEAIGAYEELREEAERDPSRSTWLPSVIALTRCYHAAGDLGRAAALGEQAIDRLDGLELSSAEEMAEVGRVLITINLDRGDADRAHALARRLLPLTEQGESPLIYERASLRALDAGWAADALYLADRALDVQPANGAQHPQGRLRVACARALLRKAAAESTAPADAAAVTQEAMSLLDAASPVVGGIDVAECRIETARAKILLGDAQTAMATAERVLRDLDTQSGAPIVLARARLVLAQAQLRDGASIEALATLSATADHLGQVPSSRAVAQVWRELGDLHGSAGDPSGMMNAYRRALESAGLRPAPRPQDAPAEMPRG